MPLTASPCSSKSGGGSDRLAPQPPPCRWPVAVLCTASVVCRPGNALLYQASGVIQKGSARQLQQPPHRLMEQCFMREHEEPDGDTPLVLPRLQESWQGGVAPLGLAAVCGMLAARPAQPLTPEALGALASQDAASHAQHLQVLRFDDRLAELASQRGLLVCFHVKSHQSQADLAVEAPEYMTVEYLKRRVAKAKLLQGESMQFLSTSRFVLRTRCSSGSAVAGGMEELPSRQACGDEVFLFDLGYKAPGPFELFITSAPQTSDREQQERMLARPLAHTLHAQYQHAAATRAGAQQSPEVVEARRSYRALLQAPACVEQQQQQQQQQPNPKRRRQSSGSSASVQALPVEHSNCLGVPPWQQLVEPAMTSIGPGTALASREEPDGEQHRAEARRRQMGRWSADEVDALIEGVQARGMHWALIHRLCVQAGRRIHRWRTQGDLKDKWRNLVRAAALPSKQQRGIELSEEQRQAILSIASSTGGPSDDGGGSLQHG